MNIESRIKQLVSDITKADDDYYNHSNPTVSDKVYDAWKDELRDCIGKCKNKKLAGQAELAINSVGAMAGVSNWRKVSHDIPMGSLNKVNTPAEFEAWAKDCGAKEVFLTEKLDGISIDTIWKDGKLVQAITRGNGDVGEDITPNVRKMEGVPAKLKKKFTGNLRGEIILRKTNWKKHFADMANPRNAASGISKKFDGEGAEHLTILMYQVAGKDFKTEVEQFQYLESLGVLVPYYNVYSDINKAIAEYQRYQKSVRESLDYDIDGMVGRVNNIADQLALGDLHHRPKGAIAFKFDAEGRETTLRKIVWQVGSTGRITPVAEFDPVELVGAKVSRSSLYNIAYINEIGVDIGAKIIVVRANDVIPRVEEVSKSTGKTAKAPTECPECGAPVTMTGEYLLCTDNAGCPAQSLGRLKMWIKENNILEWGDKVLQKVLDAGLVSDVGDLYRLTVKQLAALDRMGEKSAQNLVDVLDKHRDIALENFVGGLGIENVATSTTKLVIKAGYDTLDAMMDMSVNEFEAIPGFGYIKAQAFYDGLRLNKKRIQDIQKAGVNIKARVKGTLTGKVFAITGSTNTNRKELISFITDNGGEYKNSVSKSCTHLVIADVNSTSSKAVAARKLGVKLINEESLLNLSI